MGRLYLIRHGTTAYNKGGVGSDRIRSHADVPLTDQGRQEGRELAHQFLGEPIVAIYSSDLSRASDTAKMLRQDHRDAKLVTTPKLRSWDMGDLTGKITTPEVVAKIKEMVKNDNERPGGKGSETFREFVNRLISYCEPIFDEAAKLPGEDCISIVTHGRCVHVLDLWIEAGCDEECLHTQFVDEMTEEPDAVKPGEFIELEFVDGKWQREEDDDDEDDDAPAGDVNITINIDAGTRVYGKPKP